MTGHWRAARSSWSEAHFPRASLPEFRVAQEQFFFFVDFFDSYDGFRRRGGIVSSLTLASILTRSISYFPITDIILIL